MTFVIVGGGIAGVTVAEELRNRDPDSEVVVFNAEPAPLYSRMLLKEYAKGATAESQIRIHDESWYAANGIDLRSGRDARVIDVRDGEVVTAGGDTQPYDTLFVTAGGSQVNPFDISEEVTNAHGMWTLEQTNRIKDQIETGAIETAVVVGAGFLGLELADALAIQDVDTHYVMRGHWSRHGMGREGSEIIHRALSEHGIHVRADQSVEAFEVEGDRVTAVETSETTIECDFVGLAVGVSPNVEYLDGTDVEVNRGVVVDEHLQSADPDIYAAGDIAEYYDPLFDRYHQTGTWLSGIDQGRVAARHALGDENATFSGVEGHSVAVAGLDAPVVFLGDWDGGDDAIDRTYGETHYRRIAFEDDQPVGASLIGESGDVVGQLKQLIYRQPTIPDDEKSRLLDRFLDPEQFLSPSS